MEQKKQIKMAVLGSVTLAKSEFAEYTGQNTRQRERTEHFWKPDLPSVFEFAVCHDKNTRQTSKVCRVSRHEH
jgi:hypothetical protein